jgi:hypothetical protein
MFLISQGNCSVHPLSPGALALFLKLYPQLPSIVRDQLGTGRAHFKGWWSGLGMGAPLLSQLHSTHSL